MNDSIIQDLKQFITATISQHMTHVATKDDVEALQHQIANAATKDDLDNLRDEMREGFAGVGEVVQQILDRLDKHDDEHAGHYKKVGRRLLGWPRFIFTTLGA